LCGVAVECDHDRVAGFDLAHGQLPFLLHVVLRPWQHMRRLRLRTQRAPQHLKGLACDAGTAPRAVLRLFLRAFSKLASMASRTKSRRSIHTSVDEQSSTKTRHARGARSDSRLREMLRAFCSHAVHTWQSLNDRTGGSKKNLPGASMTWEGQAAPVALTVLARHLGPLSSSLYSMCPCR
jgi:hypothetical protein